MRVQATIMVLSLAGVGALAGCEPEPSAAGPDVRSVRYQRISRQEFDQSRAFSGAARARLETDMSFKVAGTLTERAVHVGEPLKRGQLIARIDAKDYEVPVQEAEAGLARAVAELRNAEAVYERTRGLYENRNASRSDLDVTRAQAESARAQVQASTQQLEAARLRLSYTSLYSPDECTVAETQVEVNQNVNVGQPVVRLNCGECPEVTVTVAETFIGQISQGDQVQVRFNALGGSLIPATVIEVGVAAGSVATTYPVTVALREQCDEIRSGMAADVLFPIVSQSASGEFVVPSVAVGEDRDGRFVYVLEPDDQDRWLARRRVVEVGEFVRSGLIIRSGLQEGELIVTAGVTRIADGQQVRLLAEN